MKELLDSGLTRSEIARAMGVHRSTVTRWVNDETHPRRRRLRRLRQVLNQTMERDIAAQMRSVADQADVDDGRMTGWVPVGVSTLRWWADQVDAMRDRTDEHPSLAYKLGQDDERGRLRRELQPVLAEMRKWEEYGPGDPLAAPRRWADRIEAIGAGALRADG